MMVAVFKPRVSVHTTCPEHAVGFLSVILFYFVVILFFGLFSLSSPASACYKLLWTEAQLMQLM